LEGVERGDPGYRARDESRVTLQGIIFPVTENLFVMVRNTAYMLQAEVNIESEVDDETLTDEEIAEIQEALEEVERGGFVTHEELKRDLGLE